MKEFERNKLLELQTYAQQNEGKDTYISKLKYRLREFTAEQLEQNLGVAPFVFGKGQEYWPEMDEQRTPIDRKTKFLLERTVMEEELAVNSKAQEEAKVRVMITLALKGFEKDLHDQRVKDKAKKP